MLNAKAMAERTKQYKDDKYEGLAVDLENKGQPEHAKHLRNVTKLFMCVRKFVVGQNRPVSRFIMGLFSRGPQKPQSEEDVYDAAGLSEKERFGICAHVNFVGDVGVGKTTICEVMAGSFGGKYERIQGKPDLEPEDIIGKEVMFGGGDRKFVPGPIFANLILNDEINRSMPKTQAALLEGMAEGQVTLNSALNAKAKKELEEYWKSEEFLKPFEEGEIQPYKGKDVEKRTVKLPRPFFVVATQNPLEHEGVYVLPEAQLDRFAMQVAMEKPSPEEVEEIMRVTDEEYRKQVVKPVISTQDILECQQFIANNVRVLPLIRRYVSRLVNLIVPYMDTSNDNLKYDDVFIRTHKKIHEEELLIAGKTYRMKNIVAGAVVVRMAIVIQSLARTQAFLQGRRYVTSEDVQKVFVDCAAHRIFFNARMVPLFSQHLVTEEGRRLDRLELARIVLEHVLHHTPIEFIKEAPHALEHEEAIV